MRSFRGGIALLLVVSAVAGAQGGGRGRRPAPPMRDSGRGQGMAAVRQQIEKVIREQVQPTEDQMLKMRQIDRRFESRRTDLNREELAVRRDLRAALIDTANVNQAHVSQLLDRLIAFPGRRAALVEEEQKGLAEFLTPVQRAKYHAIQEQLRRRIEQGRGGPPAGSPAGKPLASTRPPL